MHRKSYLKLSSEKGHQSPKAWSASVIHAGWRLHLLLLKRFGNTFSFSRTFIALLAACATSLLPNDAWGLEPQTALTYCNEVEQAAQAAQMKYLQAYQPRTNPTQTFDEATVPCLDFISKFKSHLPSLLDDTVLTQLGTQLLQRSCQAARDQFDKAIDEAKQAVTGRFSTLPGLDQNTVPNIFESQPAAAANATTPTAFDHLQARSPPNQRQAVQPAIDRVINILK